jgi:hypothetical protein
MEIRIIRDVIIPRWRNASLQIRSGLDSGIALAWRMTGSGYG